MVENPDSTVEGDDPTRFRFVDGTVEGAEFFERPFRLPWGTDQPNDSGGIQECVRWVETFVIGIVNNVVYRWNVGNQRWFDVDCDSEFSFVCRKICNQNIESNQNNGNNIAVAGGALAILFLVTIALFSVLLLYRTKLQQLEFVNQFAGNNKQIRPTPEPDFTISL